MEKYNIKIIIAISIVAITITGILVTLGLAFESQAPSSQHWVLHSYGNNVALFNGENIVEVYSNIVLDTLPQEDRRLLDSGISFLTSDEARIAIEDYDG